MGYIVEFTVTNLAGHSTIYSQKLNRDLNIFFGMNGSGKSSLLKILHSALLNDVTLLKDVPFSTAHVSIYSSGFKETIVRSYEQGTLASQSAKQADSENADDSLLFDVLPLGSGLQRDDLSWKTKSKSKQASNIIFVHQYLPTSRLYSDNTVRPGTQRTLLSEEQLDLYFAQTVRNVWSNYSNKVLTTVRQAQEEGLASILRTMLSPNIDTNRGNSVDPTIAYNRLHTFLERQGTPGILRTLGKPQDFQNRYESDSQFRRIVSEINSIEQKIERAMEPRERLQNAINSIFGGNKKIKFDDDSIDVETSNKESINLSSLSSGEKHLLRILIQTLLSGAFTAIIDEPELSLHIDWQRQLIGIMRSLNPKAQLILATHSPEIMAEVEDEKIFRI